MIPFVIACASVEPLDPYDTSPSLIYGYLDMEGAPTNADWVFLKYYGGDHFWYGSYIYDSGSDGQTYFLAVPKDTPYIVGGCMMIGYERVYAGGGAETVGDRRIVIPGTLRIDIQPDDEAVYVGTLRLMRDEFNEIIDAVLVDDYENTAAEFRKRFETKVPLRKAMFQATSP